MYNTMFRARGIDVTALALWLASGTLLVKLLADGSPAAVAAAAVLAGIGAAAATISGVIRGVEARVSDQMTIEHRAQQSDDGPRYLSSVR